MRKSLKVLKGIGNIIGTVAITLLATVGGSGGSYRNSRGDGSDRSDYDGDRVDCDSVGRGVWLSRK